VGGTAVVCQQTKSKAAGSQSPEHSPKISLKTEAAIMKAALQKSSDIRGKMFNLFYAESFHSL